MEERKMPHPGHEKHLCQLQYSGFMNQHFAEYKNLIRQPRFVCRKCGRAATRDTSLCEPVGLEDRET